MEIFIQSLKFKKMIKNQKIKMCIFLDETSKNDYTHVKITIKYR